MCYTHIPFHAPLSPTAAESVQEHQKNKFHFSFWYIRSSIDTNTLLFFVLFFPSFSFTFLSFIICFSFQQFCSIHNIPILFQFPFHFFFCFAVNTTVGKIIHSTTYFGVCECICLCEHLTGTSKYTMENKIIHSIRMESNEHETNTKYECICWI